MQMRNLSQSQVNFILLLFVARVIVLVNAYVQPNEYAEMSSFGKAHAHLNGEVFLQARQAMLGRSLYEKKHELESLLIHRE
jgi:hypothetical protein